MVKLNMLRAIATPIKSAFSKNSIAGVKDYKKEEKEFTEPYVTKPKIKGVDCIFMIHEMLCLEVYEDGYIKRI